jgi:hypothetical protein
MHEPCTPSVLMTVQTVAVCAAPALLANVVLHPGSAASTLTVYDNASAGSGTVLAVLLGVANGASVSLPFDIPVYCAKGITCVTAGTGAQSQVYYQREN